MQGRAQGARRARISADDLLRVAVGRYLDRRRPDECVPVGKPAADWPGSRGRADRLGADPGRIFGSTRRAAPRSNVIGRAKHALTDGTRTTAQHASTALRAPLNTAQLRSKWRRWESNTGPAMSQESAGASRRAVSGEESAGCGASGERASAWENAGESRACSNVANGPMAAELLELVDAAIIALDTGETEVARAQLQALAKAVRARDQGVSHRR